MCPESWISFLIPLFSITATQKLSKSYISNYVFIKAKISHDRISGNHLPIPSLIKNILKSSTDVNLFHDKYSHLKMKC